MTGILHIQCKMSATNSVCQTLLDRFLAQLDDKQQKCYGIAKERLGSSFSLEDSMGFQIWLKVSGKAGPSRHGMS